MERKNEIPALMRVDLGRGARSVRAEHARVTRQRVWIDLLLYPAHTLPTAAAPVMVGAGLAFHDGVFAAIPALVAFLGSWLIHVAGVFTDNHELLRRHSQVVEHPDLTAALAQKVLTLNEVKFAIAGCLLLAFPAALFFWSVAGTPALVIGVIGLVASLGYAGGPVPYAKLGLAEVVFFVMFGIVAVAGTYYAQLTWHEAVASHSAALASLPVSAFLVGLPVGALVTNILIIDDLRDRRFDAIKGWRTLAVRLGQAGSRRAYVALSFFAYLAPFAFWRMAGFDGWVLLPIATLPWALRIGRVLLKQEHIEGLARLTSSASLLSCAYAALLAIGIAASSG